MTESALDIQIELHPDYYIAKWPKEARIRQIIDHIQWVLGPDYTYPHYIVIHDLSGIEKYSISADEIRRVAELKKQVEEKFPVCHSVFVSPSIVGYGLSRMYQAYMSVMSSIKVDVVKEMDDALMIITHRINSDQKNDEAI